MPTYTVHAPPPRQKRNNERTGALRVCARWFLFLGFSACAAVVVAARPLARPSLSILLATELSPAVLPSCTPRRMCSFWLAC